LRFEALTAELKATAQIMFVVLQQEIMSKQHDLKTQVNNFENGRGEECIFKI
jgi:hypothetical protein